MNFKVSNFKNKYIQCKTVQLFYALKDNDAQINKEINDLSAYNEAEEARIKAFEGKVLANMEGLLYLMQAEKKLQQDLREQFERRRARLGLKGELSEN